MQRNDTNDLAIVNSHQQSLIRVGDQLGDAPLDEGFRSRIAQGVQKSGYGGSIGKVRRFDLDHWTFLLVQEPLRAAASG